MQKIKLTDNQLDKITNFINRRNALSLELQAVDSIMTDFASLICEFNEIDIKDKEFNVDINTKELTVIKK